MSGRRPGRARGERPSIRSATAGTGAGLSGADGASRPRSASRGAGRVMVRGSLSTPTRCAERKPRPPNGRGAYHRQRVGGGPRPPCGRNRRGSYRAPGGQTPGLPPQGVALHCGKSVWSRRRGTRGGGRRGLPRSVHKLLRLSMAGVPSAGRTRSPRCDAILTMKEDALGGFHA